MAVTEVERGERWEAGTGETRMFYEIVIAPSYTEEGLATLKGKSKNLRILEAAPRVSGARALRQVSTHREGKRERDRETERHRERERAWTWWTHAGGGNALAFNSQSPATLPARMWNDYPLLLSTIFRNLATTLRGPC